MVWKGMRNFCLKFSQRTHEGKNCSLTLLTQNTTQGQKPGIIISVCPHTAFNIGGKCSNLTASSKWS